MMRWKFAALLCIAASMVAAGCSDKPNNAAIEAQRQSHAAKLQADLNKPVEPRVYQFGRNELVMLEIPIASGMGMAPSLAVVAIGLDPIWSSRIADRPNDETQLHNQPDASKIMTRQLAITKQEAQ